MPYAKTEGPDDRAHPCSLIWTFSVRRRILQYPLIMITGNENPDQPTQAYQVLCCPQIA